MLFKCHWFDPSEGMRVHDKYDLIDINQSKLYRKNDPFILAQQAIQVYYPPYPSAKRDRANWWAVCRTKAQSIIEQEWTNDVQEAY